ncbi:MAG: SCP2 sterol-binding domain-containing protein [Agathobacter sp.]|nr:SCP2 sterol-binding domain-containing protein [Agathobacter sp.]
MTYHELVEKVTEAYAKVDAKNVKEHIAVQYNVYGEGEGAFYIEISNGRIEVAPFEYYDRDAIIAIAGEALLDVVTSKTTYEAVEEAGRLVVVGNADKANKLMALSIKKAAEKKTAAKKAETKKEPAKKTTAKKTTAKKDTK